MTTLTQIFANNATTVLSSGVAATDTTINVVNATGFPIPGTNQFFYITIESGLNIEIIKVTGVSGNSFTGCTRAQEGTTAQSFVTGTRVDNRLTAGTLGQFITISNVAELSSVDLLTSPVTSNTNLYSCHSNDVDGSPILAIRNSNSLWEFTTHKFTVVSGTVLTSSTTGITSVAIASIIPVSPITGDFIIQFTSGVNAGSARAVTTASTNTVGWATAFTTAPSTGDTFVIYKSNIQTITDLSTGISGVYAPIINPTFTGTATLPAGSIAPGLLGSANNTVAAAGTTQGTATQLSADVNVITSGATNAGVRCASAVSGKIVTISNRSGNTIIIYPNTGEFFDGLGVNTGISLPQNAYIEMAASATGQWNTTTNAIINASMIIGTVSIATNIASGSANQIPYQTGSGTTSFYTASNYGVQIYGATGVPASIVGAAGVLQGSASAIPSWTTTPTLTGTNFSAIPNTALTNSSVTIGSTNVALGATVTTFAGLTSVTSTTFVGALTGNASTATTAGTVTTAAQPTITSTGTLTSLTVTGLVTANTGVTVAGATTKLAVGTATLAPLTFQSGVNLTTPIAGVMEYDGTCLYGSVAASTRGVLVTEQLEAISASYTLTSQTAAQKLLNGTTNGTVTLPVGTYEFECSFALTSLSATSGTFGFALGGTATFTQAWTSFAGLGVGTTATTPQVTFNSAANTALTAAGTTAAGNAFIKGILRVTVAGTVIPQVSLSVAAAAVVGANSYFKVNPVGAAAVVSVGNWS